jgi:hypothetical protein
MTANVRTVTPTILARAFALLAVISAVAGFLTQSGDEIAAAVISLPALAAFWWFGSADLDGTPLSRRWKVVAAVSGVVLVGATTTAAARRIHHHEYWGTAMSVSYGIWFLGTSISLIWHGRSASSPTIDSGI